MQRCPGWKACCAKVCGSDRAFARPRMSLRSCGLRLRTGVARMSEARSGARPFRYHGLSDTTALQIRSEDSMNRRRFLKSTASLGIALASPPLIARAAAKELLVAEPVHGTGYLPMYIAMANNYFAESDIVVKIVTIETGSGHTNAVLSGQAFAFIGGPEHDAFAKAKGAELRAIVHCVDRGNVYINAIKGQEPKDANWPAYFKGKAVATGGFGGTPNSITRYLLKKWNLDAKTDVTVVETANSAILAAVRAKRAQLGCSTEPFITQGVPQ